MALHAVRVCSVTRKQFAADWDCYVLGGIGFTWNCNCGAHGKVYATYRQALVEGRLHREEAERATRPKYH